MGENNILNKKIKLLKILSEGCKIHPAYRAHRKARLEFNELNES